MGAAELSDAMKLAIEHCYGQRSEVSVVELTRNRSFWQNHILAPDIPNYSVQLLVTYILIGIRVHWVYCGANVNIARRLLAVYVSL